MKTLIAFYNLLAFLITLLVATFAALYLAPYRKEKKKPVRRTGMRLSLDTRMPSPMLKRIQEAFYPEKVAAQEALKEAKRELVEEHDRTACYN